MSVHNAREFIKRVRRDAYFRDELNSSTPEEIRAILERENLSFTQGHMTEAHSNMLANSPNADSADELRDLLNWWRIISS